MTIDYTGLAFAALLLAFGVAIGAIGWRLGERHPKAGIAFYAAGLTLGCVALFGFSDVANMALSG